MLKGCPTRKGKGWICSLVTLFLSPSVFTNSLSVTEPEDMTNRQKSTPDVPLYIPARNLHSPTVLLLTHSLHAPERHNYDVTDKMFSVYLQDVVSLHA